MGSSLWTRSFSRIRTLTDLLFAYVSQHPEEFGRLSEFDGAQ